MSETEQAFFGAGCFWGAEAAFRKLPGVTDTRVGYANENAPNATRIEVVKVDFSPAKLTFELLIEHFWDLHDPTSVDRQGEDVGTKYRSAIFTTSSQQTDVAREAISKLDSSGRFSRPIVTVVLPLGQFDMASDEDQRYLERNGLFSCGL
ncbi:peptide-methionine (S)-S-oxide reductase MsrA [Paraburkholderia fungorum]|uniref:peptide-methionine (S)-S-oxide reductase MsrA n=1 Tax=Paraburkholderia fungorum TaxID=134537 RepID=UPI0038BD37B2